MTNIEYYSELIDGAVEYITENPELLPKEGEMGYQWYDRIRDEIFYYFGGYDYPFAGETPEFYFEVLSACREDILDMINELGLDDDNKVSELFSDPGSFVQCLATYSTDMLMGDILERVIEKFNLPFTKKDLDNPNTYMV